MKLGLGFSFSQKRALGVTKAKRRVSKATGIPMSQTWQTQNRYPGGSSVRRRIQST